MNRRAVLVGAVAGVVGLVGAGPAVAVDGDREVVRVLERDAKPLPDLAAFGRMVGDADVVGVGEATHSSREFFTMKHRVFRYLVEHKGFRSFSLEIAWSSGVRLNDYVLYGKGDLEQILREEFVIWNTAEFRDLFRWMREYNRTHRDKVQFSGNDISYPGPEIFESIFRYAGRHRPGLLPAYLELYRKLSPPSTDAEGWMYAYLDRPIAERRAIAAETRAAFQRLQSAGGSTREYTWAEQNARVLDQTMKLLGTDLGNQAELAKAMLHRDQSMADNTAWWHEYTGDKVLLSAHNGHIALVSTDPQSYPKMQGEFLRERLGDRYLAVGFTFHQGSFNARGDEDRRWRTFTLGPAGPINNEHSLDRVKYRDYYLDMRSTAARPWLSQSRPTRNIGLQYPYPDEPTKLAATYDVLIHLHRITAAELLPGPSTQWAPRGSARAGSS